MIEPSLEPNQVTNYIINNYTYAGLKGLIIIGVSAMAMSSADSFINDSAVLFAHDLEEVLNIKANNLMLSKLFSLILGFRSSTKSVLIAMTAGFSTVVLWKLLSI